jgi:PhzF family phenazine biosynthesis protein
MLLYQVDAFADAPFTGNPAAVCLLSADVGDGWMQDVAMEMNLSETAFLRRQNDGVIRLRWFTPSHEVDLCGHATLASAHVLWDEGLLSESETAQFDTASGRLEAVMGEDGWITLDFPADPVSPVDDPPEALVRGLNLRDPGSQVVFTGSSSRDLFVRLRDPAAVYDLEPDLSAIRTLDTRGVIVTARAGDDNEADFVSRFFAPQTGVPEDPVTGSAHCALAPYWARELGRTELTGRQVSPRGGTVRVALDSPGADRVSLSGQAVTVFHGRLRT